LKDKCEYKELGADYINKKNESKRKAYLKSEFVKLGYNVELTEITTIENAV